MTLLPRVTALTSERLSREFDALGPEACVAELTHLLEDTNPEVLDMMSRCAKDVGDSAQAMVGFAMFYRLLVAEARAMGGLPEGFHYLARVTEETRALVVKEIDDKGEEGFTIAACDQLSDENPELLRMAYSFASRRRDYLPLIKGFCLIYRAIALQSAVERELLH